ncbi:MAG TPA: hypothetical protein VN721_13405 [Flavipsychrobacter sp.]|nr:hypothetical protein [Flavipsychrobacter sp.]
MKKATLLLLLAAFFISCKKNKQTSPSTPETAKILSSITGYLPIYNDPGIVKSTLTLKYNGNNIVQFALPNYPLAGNIILAYQGNNCTKISFYDSTNSSLIGYHDITYNSNDEVASIKTYGYFDKYINSLDNTQSFDFYYSNSILSKIVWKSPAVSDTIYYKIQRDAANDITQLHQYVIDTIQSSNDDTTSIYSYTYNTTINKQNFFPIIWLVEGSLKMNHAKYIDITTAMPYLNRHQMVIDSFTSNSEIIYQYMNDNNGNIVARMESEIFHLNDSTFYSYK